MAKKGLTKKEKEILQKFKTNIKRRLPGQVLDVILYGSKARGDATKFSDTDILVVLKNVNEQNKDKVYDVSTRLQLKYDLYNLSVKVWSKQEFDRFTGIPTVFIKSISKHWISLMSHSLSRSIS